MRTDRSQSTLQMAAGLSSHPKAAGAVDQVCEQVAAGLPKGPVDLAILFFSAHHSPHAAEMLATLRRQLDPKCIVAASAEAVIGGGVELERVPGVSLLAGSLPGVTVAPFTSDDLEPADDSPDGLERLESAIDAGPSLRATFFIADPFTVPMVKLLPAMNAAKRDAGAPSAAIIGGMASGSRAPGGNVLILNDRVMHGGAVGVSLSGAMRVDAVVSQGCKPFGPTTVITKARHNMILELGGRATREVVGEAIASLGDKAKDTLKEGLLVGLVINEYKERFGRDDFLIRSVVGLNPEDGSIAVGDLVKVGQTIRFHHRDKATAAEDLAMLMDAQRLHDRPAGVLLLTCNGRGQKLFGYPHNDASTVARTFLPPVSGEEVAKGGLVFSPGVRASVPMAGFFCAGEIGPVGEESYLHGQTACVVMFREGRGGS